jgi:DNA-directed RNA polymerase specialized sigma24 family protein
MSTPVPRRNELDSEDSSPGNRSSTPEGFLALLRLQEKVLYKAAWALCDRADLIEHLLERTVSSVWDDRSRTSPNQPFRRRLADKLIETSRIIRTSVSASPKGDFSATIEARESSSELSLRVHHALQSLTWDRREAFVLRDLMGFSALQCAEILRISHAEARQLISDARLRMTQELSAPVSTRAVGGGL